jgi:hypothetical protein
MPAVEFPKRDLAAFQDLAARIFESRKAESDHEPLARHLLVTFYDLCMLQGLDRVLAELQAAFPPLDINDRFALADHEVLLPALVAQLATIDLDGGGPRNAKPRQITECVVATLGLTPMEAPDRSIPLAGDVRTEVAAALASVVDAELAVPKIRETVIAEARARCEERFHGAFNKIVAHLDATGMQLIKQPKVAIDAVQVVQQVLVDTRNALVDRVGRAAIDRAKQVLARADATAAARVDLPITLRLTPRDVAILRACQANVPKIPARLVLSLLDSLTELVPIAWLTPERAARPYAASQTFAVGDLIEHPKFGLGTVVSCLAQRIDVEFPDGKHTLAHVAPKTR